MVNTNPSRKEREQACTACPDKCRVYVEKKHASYSPTARITFQMRHNPDLLYQSCVNYRNRPEEFDDFAEKIRQNKQNNIESKVIDEKIESPPEPVHSFKETNEEQMKQRHEIADKEGNEILEAFNGDREKLLYVINNYSKIKLETSNNKLTERLLGLMAHNEYATLKWTERQEFLKKVNKPENTAKLEERLHEAYNYLKIPVAKETEIVDRMIVYDKTMCQQNIDSFIDQFYVFSQMSGNPDQMHETYEHSVRCSLYSIKIAEFLGFDGNYKTKFFCAALLHDIGKFKVFNHSEEESFDPEKNQEMKEHPQLASIFTGNIDKEVSSVIGLHHSYQENSYKPAEINETMEVGYLSKLLAVIDFYDSASTRKNKKLLSVWDKFLGKVLPSGDKVRKELVDSYGGLYIDYSGTMLPQSNKKGKLLIDELYQKGIFGNENPLNPFPDKESFRYHK